MNISITEIYKKYSIPINLQTHMLRVAALAKIITDHIHPEIHLNKDTIIQACLLHDMGNIIKFDLSNTELLDPKDKRRVDELVVTREYFLKHFGNTPDEATLNILEDLKVDNKVIGLVVDSHWEKAAQFKQNDIDEKITCYVDQRISPFGLETIEDRFENLIQRRPESEDRIRELFRDAVKLEKDIQKITTIVLQDVSNNMIEDELARISNTRITTHD